MGVHHRVLNIGRQLKKCGLVTMVYTGKEESADSQAATQREFGDLIIMKPRVFQGPDFLQRLHYKIDFHGPWHYADKVSREDREVFDRLRREHDVVWFHTLEAADCFGLGKVSRSIMDLDDLNQQKFSLMAQQAKGLRSKLATKLLTYKWKRREKQVLQRFDLATVCSTFDRQYLGGDQRIHVIPNGFERPLQEVKRQAAGKRRLGFIGNLDYGPNFDGLQWFGEKIWPLIIKEIPTAKLRIAGKIPEKRDLLDRPGFEWLGFVEDTAVEFAGWSAMVVPLRIGGGTRLKIIEALSKRCPVVSTPVGAHGLEVAHEKNMLLVEQPEVFVQACLKLLWDDASGEKLADAGRDLFEKKYTWDVIGRAIKQAVMVCRTLND
jgi:glycosyltransferase involved in cell wall biosynthesis